MAVVGHEPTAITRAIRDRIARSEPLLAPGAVGVPLAQMALLLEFPLKSTIWTLVALVSGLSAAAFLRPLRKDPNADPRMVSLWMALHGAVMGSSALIFGFRKGDLPTQSVGLAILSFAGVVSAVALSGDRTWGVYRLAGMYSPIFLWAIFNGDIRILLTLLMIVGSVAVVHDVFTRMGRGAVQATLHSDELMNKLEEVNERLRYQITHDSLTGLSTRDAFLRHLELALSSERFLAVGFIDVDNFKAINDGFGHDIGDRVLVVVARRLQKLCTDADLAARRSGDEFIVLVSEESPNTDVALAKALHAAVSGPEEINGHVIDITCSVGMTVCDEGDFASALLRRADKALYAAKGQGRDRGVGYSTIGNDPVFATAG